MDIGPPNPSVTRGETRGGVQPSGLARLGGSTSPMPRGSAACSAEGLCFAKEANQRKSSHRRRSFPVRRRKRRKLAGKSVTFRRARQLSRAYRRSALRRWTAMHGHGSWQPSSFTRRAPQLLCCLPAGCRLIRVAISGFWGPQFSRCRTDGPGNDVGRIRRSLERA